MSKPDFITFTGIDIYTDLARVQSISESFPCEWGILFSRNRQGLDNRYPNLDFVDKALGFTGIKFAAHICGKYAHEVMAGQFDRKSLPLETFSRIQVNHTSPNPSVLRDFSQPHQPVIAQWRDPVHFPSNDEGVSWLYDPSGGMGKRPDTWPSNPSSQIVGYAGGINPSNVSTINDAVGDLSASGYWLDMETGVRNDDKLDLDLAESVLLAIYG